MVRMFTVVLVIVAVAGVWGVLAVAFALLAGGIIHARDHQDAPYGGFARPRSSEPRVAAPLVRSTRAL
ncbi:hypothetical protein [uncultured Amnibacterium sp.]|uniref:hypothetical protein n=1 Tax=uncultured Amnibacterium sp. TaxID=1631851 RepID=UPI0035CA3DE8